MLFEEEVGWHCIVEKKKSGGGRSGAIHWRRRRQLEHHLSEQRQRYMQIGPGGHLKGLQTQQLKGCCWAVITKHEIQSQARRDVQAQACGPGRDL